MVLAFRPQQSPGWPGLLRELPGVRRAVRGPARTGSTARGGIGSPLGQDRPLLAFLGGHGTRIRLRCQSADAAPLACPAPDGLAAEAGGANTVVTASGALRWAGLRFLARPAGRGGRAGGRLAPPESPARHAAPG